MVDADPDQLFRVLVNIARNAVQALESRAAADPIPAATRSASSGCARVRWW